MLSNLENSVIKKIEIITLKSDRLVFSFKIPITNGFLHCIVTLTPQSQMCNDTLSFLLPFSGKGLIFQSLLFFLFCVGFSFPINFLLLKCN